MSLRKPIDYVLEDIWEDANFNGVKELGFLRAIHNEEALTRLAIFLNLSLLKQNKIATLSSTWTDQTPQCYQINARGNPAKPSCELADLLVVVKDEVLKTQTAILLQGKLAKKPNTLPLGKSTTKELKLMAKPHFLLSNDLKKPVPIIKDDLSSSTFNLTNIKSNKHLLFLLIKEEETKSWTRNIASWLTYYPNESCLSSAYSRALVSICKYGDNNFGLNFNPNGASEWDRLIRVLLKNSSPTAAKGKSYFPTHQVVDTNKMQVALDELAITHFDRSYNFWRLQRDQMNSFVQSLNQFGNRPPTQSNEFLGERYPLIPTLIVNLYANHD
jgi:hypothetical protein